MPVSVCLAEVLLGPVYAGRGDAVGQLMGGEEGVALVLRWFETAEYGVLLQQARASELPGEAAVEVEEDASYR